MSTRAIFLQIAMIVGVLTQHGSTTAAIIIPLEEENVLVQAMFADFTVASIARALGDDPSFPSLTYTSTFDNSGWSGTLTGSWLGNPVNVNYAGTISQSSTTSFEFSGRGDLGFLIGGFDHSGELSQVSNNKASFQMIIDYDRDFFGTDTFDSDPLVDKNKGGEN